MIQPLIPRSGLSRYSQPIPGAPPPRTRALEAALASVATAGLASGAPVLGGDRPCPRRAGPGRHRRGAQGGGAVHDGAAVEPTIAQVRTPKVDPRLQSPVVSARGRCPRPSRSAGSWLLRGSGPDERGGGPPRCIDAAWRPRRIIESSPPAGRTPRAYPGSTGDAEETLQRSERDGRERALRTRHRTVSTSGLGPRAAGRRAQARPRTARPRRRRPRRRPVRGRGISGDAGVDRRGLPNLHSAPRPGLPASSSRPRRSPVRRDRVASAPTRGRISG